MTALSALGLTPDVGQPRAASIESPLVPLTASTLVEWLTGPKVRAGVSVTEHSGLAMPAVWRAVTLISAVCAALPLHAYKPTEQGRERQITGVAAELLDDPHPDLTPFELWELVYGSLCLWGNAYLRKLRNQSGQIVELWWIAPARVKTGRADDGSKVYVIDGDTERPLFDDTILHIPGFGYDGIVGVSPIRLHREGIGLALAAEQAGGQLFGNGFMAAGILTSDQRLDDGKATELKTRWKERVGAGVDTAHDVVVLGSGAKYQQLTIPPEDAQYLGSRKFQIEEVARMYGLPAHLLAHTEPSTSWGTGIEQMTLGLIVYTLSPYWLTRVEQRMTKTLRPGPVYAKYALEGLLRGDTAARAEFYGKLWGIGVFSTNDILTLEDRKTIGPAGDVRYRPLNMGVLGEPDPAGSTGPAEPAEPAEPSPPRRLAHTEGAPADA